MQSNLNLFIRPDMIEPSQRGSPLYKDLPALLRQKQFFSTYWKKSYWYLNRVSTIFVFNFFYFYLIFSWEDLKSHSTPHTTIHNQLSYRSGQFLRALLMMWHLRPNYRMELHPAQLSLHPRSMHHCKHIYHCHSPKVKWSANKIKINK